MIDNKTAIPAEARKIAESAVEQTRKAYETVAQASEKAMAPIQSALPPAAQEFNNKIFSYTNNNISEMFDLAQKIVQATSLEEVTKLQAQYLADQTRTFQQQAQELTSSFKDAGSRSSGKASKGKTSFEE